MEIAGSSVLVTGASGGLGSAMARELARRGAHLVLTARNEEALDALAAEVDGEVEVADLADRAAVERVAARAAACDVLVANAGIGGDPSLDDLDEAALDQALDGYRRSPLVLSQAFAKAKIAGKPGQIVLVGSLAGIAASPGTRLYNATKFGLRGFAHSFRQELDGTGVGCSLISPGFIRDAGMFADGNTDLPPGVRTKQPQDVADAVVKAITANPGEVFVSPLELRIASTFATVAPSVSAFIQRKLDVRNRVDY